MVWTELCHYSLLYCTMKQVSQSSQQAHLPSISPAQDNVSDRCTPIAFFKTLTINKWDDRFDWILRVRLSKIQNGKWSPGKLDWPIERHHTVMINKESPNRSYQTRVIIWKLSHGIQPPFFTATNTLSQFSSRFSLKTSPRFR